MSVDDGKERGFRDDVVGFTEDEHSSDLLFQHIFTSKTRHASL